MPRCSRRHEKWKSFSRPDGLLCIWPALSFVHYVLHHLSIINIALDLSPKRKAVPTRGLFVCALLHIWLSIGSTALLCVSAARRGVDQKRRGWQFSTPGNWDVVASNWELCTEIYQQIPLGALLLISFLPYFTDFEQGYIPYSKCCVILDPICSTLYRTLGRRKPFSIMLPVKFNNLLVGHCDDGI